MNFCKELHWSLSTFAASLFLGKKKKKNLAMQNGASTVSLDFGCCMLYHLTAYLSEAKNRF